MTCWTRTKIKKSWGWLILYQDEDGNQEFFNNIDNCQKFIEEVMYKIDIGQIIKENYRMQNSEFPWIKY